MVRYIVSLVLLLTANATFASCFGALDNSHACRYPAGDAWCQQRRYGGYAYEDKCLKYHAPPGGGGGSVAPSADKYVRVINKSGEPLIWVYITEAGDGNWGADQLGSRVIPPGGAHKWNIPWSGCNVDVRAKTASGNIAERFGVDACGGLTWTLY